MGLGVFKNTMTELMNLIFSDNSAWTRVDGGHVVDIPPVGITQDPLRLRLLKTYGYACMLYIALQHSLPIPLSPVFSYALLKTDGDASILEDMPFIRQVAPGAATLLDLWPSSPQGFIDLKDDQTLKAMTVEYFNKTVRLHFSS